MRYIFNFILFTFLGSQVSLGQVLDTPPTGIQNILPVEGGGIRMEIDSVTPLNTLIERLNGNWNFLQTGKAYWIGYTEDMFSIASRGKAAIPALMEFIRNTKKKKAKTGAICALHLIGINREIVGRFEEKFVIPEAREALRKLLLQPDLTYLVTRLLMRDPWKSDLPFFIDILQSKATQETCWPIINSLRRYTIPGLPLANQVPDSLLDLSISLKVENKPERDFNFTDQIKEALKEFKNRYPEKISVEEKLFEDELAEYNKSGLSGSLSISKFLNSIDIGQDYGFSYLTIGCKLQYYTENGKLNFFTISTARQRLINWWKGLSVEEKKIFN